MTRISQSTEQHAPAVTLQDGSGQSSTFGDKDLTSVALRPGPSRGKRVRRLGGCEAAFSGVEQRLILSALLQQDMAKVMVCHTESAANFLLPSMSKVWLLYGASIWYLYLCECHEFPEGYTPK